MEESGTAFENLDLSVAQVRDLAERLAGQVIDLRSSNGIERTV
jgi:hypothetical protein